MNSGTVLKAGKDIDGTEIFYALKEDVVLNKGIVKTLKNIYLKKDINTGIKQIFACPVANSEDGIGGKLESADQSWKTFGSPGTSPLAEIGFAVASPYLFLNEGNREITFRFYVPGSDSVNFTATDINELFNLQLSGENGWIDVPIVAGSLRVDTSKEFFEITVALDGGDDAVVPYSAEIHLYNFNVSMPVAKFTLKNSSASDAVLDISFNKIMIITSVENLKNVNIQNDLSILDPSKPFELFGTSPHTGSSFIIGCKELFIKTLNPSENITGEIKFKWEDFGEIPDYLKFNEVSVSVLENSEWDSIGGNENLFSRSKKAEIKAGNSYQIFKKGSVNSKVPGSITEFSTIDFTLKKMNVEAEYYDTENYSVKSKWGFLKLDSEDVFTDSGSDIFSPKVKEISLSYDAAASHTFSLEEASAFIHITPFGSKVISNNDSAKQLFPAFENEGELYIGVKNFKTDQTLSLLFKVSEGSADPLVSKEEIVWSFLGKDNEWIDFLKEDIADSTDDLTNTGIIKFNISDEAFSDNTLMTEQLHWLRATISSNTNAVCKLISVIAQAATAKFSDHKNTGNYFKNTLAANSIGKLLISDSAVKKITQPYSSVNGKAKETDEHFYTRVSERLRHKNRAIAMWDYERIVLEEFPQIYKAKCVNHTQILEETVPGNVVFTDNELKPGYVLFVPIPDISNQNAYDPLRPYTSLGLLTDIRKYLCKYISPHVNLDVRNPLFEEIQLDFKVKFLTEDNSFYEKQLKLDIEQYMSPWAYDPQTDIEFAGKITKSSLIDFIEERSYVDFLSCVRMYQITGGLKSKDLEEAMAGTSRSVFVSVKSDDPINAHKISFIEDECECDGK
ncbi:MAG: baseplate J/gp47 family protein [Ignavibacteria bacterium]|nr:baseplate J/gp47 family protein [Ignavibacteria bacterium]